MVEGDDISEDDLREQKQILIRFYQISNLFSSVDFKNKDYAQGSYQALHIATLILRDLLSKMHGVKSNDLDDIEERARKVFDRNSEQLRTKGLWTK